MCTSTLSSRFSLTNICANFDSDITIDIDRVRKGSKRKREAVKNSHKLHDGNLFKNEDHDGRGTYRTVFTSVNHCTKDTAAVKRIHLVKERHDLSLTKEKGEEQAEVRNVSAFQNVQQIGKGSYGSVFMCIDKDTGETVAIKIFHRENEKENSFPLSAIREVNILKCLHHENIVKLKEIAVSNGNEGPDFSIVFEYFEFDLNGILQTSDICYNRDHIKSWSHQLINGIRHAHMKRIIHRDLKPSNLLVNNRGQLKIADWGLARSWSSDAKNLTNPVITLWYRPPELLLGCTDYTAKVDMWSIGCIIVEMFHRCPFLKGDNESEQTGLIFRNYGYPAVEDWLGIQKTCFLWKIYRPNCSCSPRRIRDALKAKLTDPYSQWMTECAKDLIDSLLRLNPIKRWSAEQARLAKYFFEAPLVKPAEQLPMKFPVKYIHEFGTQRGMKQQNMKK